MSVAQPEELDPIFWQSKCTDGVASFPHAQSCELGWRILSRTRMRTGTIGQHQDMHVTPRA